MTTKLVRAVRAGFYSAQYRNPGDVFALREGDALGKWMELVDPATEEKVEVAPEVPPAPLQGERPTEPADVKRAICEAAAQIDMADPENVTKDGLPSPKALKKVLGWQPNYPQVKAALKGASDAA